MKPDWDKLMREYEGSTAVGVYDVDCTAGGKALCNRAGVRGYPTILHGDPGNIAGLEKYNGGRTFDALSRFTQTGLLGDKSAGKDSAPVPPPLPPKKPPPAFTAGKKPPARLPGKAKKPPLGRGKRPAPSSAKKGPFGTRPAPSFNRKPFASTKGSQDAKKAQAAAAARRASAAKGKKGAAPWPAKTNSHKANQQRAEAQRRAKERKGQTEAAKRKYGAAAAARRQQQEKARVQNANHIKSKEL